ncbi:MULTISPECIES: dTMP kinase [Idiomarina]|uniref:Thymidylate kinase n=1 Tax=Idiomarina baltica OS145 TaxID=314276 RepID=A0ABM9WJ47_9GAMM|nr:MULTISPECIES: dTMP kinase [Idiomarina]EAQ30882.1 Thymidylate kinase [Idiomarina baltica OS145]MAF75356.1 dTMP kinase [Idiomarinaceae bacterium]MEC8924823.1 dTMP kinase [Pseudomonadota bacterium]HAE90620.1 dTMP kinase [Idiomarina sp.]|tara:strand:- start:6612 stop:7229 length:618 start_codon:yes stop_codon:yes gene_type:complete
MEGKFVVIEGLEGAGKSSAMASVVSHLQAKGIRTETVREPGGTPMAEAIRSLVKQRWEEQVQPATELLLMYASRVQLVKTVIEPALEQGAWVIGDRHDLSSQAYQGGGRELGAELLEKLKDIALGSFVPDLTLYLDVDEETGLQRARGRGELDRIEEEDIEFFRRTRTRYLELAKRDPNIVIINANQEMLNVHQAILRALEEHLF